MNFPNQTLPAKAIWSNSAGQTDEYTDFYPHIDFKREHSYILRIVCDTDRAVYLDDRLISFGQYADYPETPVYEDICFQADPQSILKITAWHSGITSQTHVATKAYAAFCIFEDGRLVYSSSRETLCRPTPEYVAHKCRIITSQMGAGFTLDGRAEPLPLSSSVEADISITSLRKRPIKPLYLGEPIEARTVKHGFFSADRDSDSAKAMAKAELDVDVGNGAYYLFDLGGEHVGFPEITFDAEDECEVMIGWGEHIIDGMCRAAIHSRRFTTEISACKGKNYYFPVLRRFGMRYMQLFFSSRKVSNVSLTFHPTLLPVSIVHKAFIGEKSVLRDEIRGTALHTLRCCMHEHYEDCPWREQALYTLDSRNQMLAGYRVFSDKNKDYVRANLDLISRGVRKDGLLSLCFPAGLDYPIPFYTLAYFMQMDEYIIHTGDTSLAAEKSDILIPLLDNFLARTTDEDLIRRFPDSENYWNFYEWSRFLSGEKAYINTPPDELPYEANLNAALSLAAACMARICNAIGKGEYSIKYAQRSKDIASAISRVFYDPETKLFFDFSDRPKLTPSVLTQAMCVLCGAADELPRGTMLDAISRNGGACEGSEVIPATLSMACFRYDALLRFDRARYSRVILDEIDRDCGYMLSRGATSFWETLNGASDFGGAGSLCHGWSAMAAYYYDILL